MGIGQQRGKTIERHLTLRCKMQLIFPEVPEALAALGTYA